MVVPRLSLEGLDGDSFGTQTDSEVGGPQSPGAASDACASALVGHRAYLSLDGLDYVPGLDTGVVDRAPALPAQRLAQHCGHAKGTKEKVKFSRVVHKSVRNIKRALARAAQRLQHRYQQVSSMTTYHMPRLRLLG